MKQYSKIKRKWEDCDRNSRRFLQRNSNWLDTVIKISISDYSSEASTQKKPGGRGRPEKEFGFSSERRRRRKASEICKNDTELLVYAAQKSLRLDGKHKEAKLIKEAMTTSSRISEAWSASQNVTNIISYTPAEALGLMIDSGLMKNLYQVIRTQAKSRGADIYPSYKRIREAKAECYPPKESIHITETISEIELQALLDLTVRRIIQLQSEVLQHAQSMLHNLHLISKWGCDGNSGHSLYKQVFTATQQSDRCTCSRAR